MNCVQGDDFNQSTLGGCLAPETLTAIAPLGRNAQQIAYRWAVGWPKETQALERSGMLIDMLKDQAYREQSTLADAHRSAENCHLADHEIMELFDLPIRPPF